MLAQMSKSHFNEFFFENANVTKNVIKMFPKQKISFPFDFEKCRMQPNYNILKNKFTYDKNVIKISRTRKKVTVNKKCH